MDRSSSCIATLILVSLLCSAASAAPTEALACTLDGDCDDFAACTVDTCEVGVCVFTPVLDGTTCESDGDQCTDDECFAGVCTHPSAPNGTSCDDGLACTVDDICQLGFCTGGAPPNCSGAGDQCNTASCDAAGTEGNCDTLTPVIDGLACDDGVTCNVGETCQLGVCSGGAQVDCSLAGDQCNTASCDVAGGEGNCDTMTPINEGLGCDDGNACNAGETCSSGDCTGGSPVVNGSVCDDGFACNVGEDCQGGVCTGGTPVASCRVYVDATATGAADGTSWGDAYTNIQDSLLDAAAATSAEVWVAADVYHPDDGVGETPGDRAATFQLVNNVGLYGGFAGWETLLTQRDPAANETILDGDLDDDDADVACNLDSPDCDSFGGICLDGSCIIKDNNTENSYHVVTGSGLDATAIVDGFTVTSGHADGVFPEDRGAGMYNLSGSPTVKNCTFTGNSASIVGGGMTNFSSSSPTVANCAFSGNGASFGGGMRNESDSNPLVTNCTFRGNSASSDGGGMHNFSSSPTVTNSAFSGNAADRDGGGIFNTSTSNSTLTNCTFTGNSADVGGGIHNSNDSGPTITNCTFSGNTAAIDGGGMYTVGGPSTPTLDNSILWGNVDDSDGDSGGPFTDESAQIHTASGTPVVNYSIVQGGWTGGGGVGNGSSDPMFVDADGADNIVGTVDDNLRLSFGSPAIDEGDNSAVPQDTADLDGDFNTTEPIPFDLVGNDRFVDDPATPNGGAGAPPIVDIGAFELEPPIFVDASATGANDGTSWSDAYVHLQGALTEAAGTPRDIWVADGTYMPDGGRTPTGAAHVPGSGDRSATFQLINNVAILGGFDGTENSLSQRNPLVNITTLDGDLDDDDIADVMGFFNCYSDSGCAFDSGCASFDVDVDGDVDADDGNIDDNSLHVVTGSGTNASSVLDGCTIQSGHADGANPDDRGGGLFNNSGSPTVSICTFQHNAAGNRPSPGCSVRQGGGGAIYNSSASVATITDCTLTNNMSVNGGGGMLNLDSPLITNCVFSDNIAHASGGAMNNSGLSAAPTITGCMFVGNWASFGGGAMRNIFDSSPGITNCVFIGNSTDTASGGAIRNNTNSSPSLVNCVLAFNSAFGGGAIYNSLDSSPTLTNCTLNGNTASGNGGGITNNSQGSNSPTLTNCILWDNSDSGGTDESAQIHTDSGTPVVNYSVVQGGWSGLGGTGIVTTDPLFVDADGADNIPGTADDDLRLLTGSPCIDAADTPAVPADTADLDDDGDTAERTPYDLDGNARVVDDLLTPDTGVPGSPTADIGAYEFSRDCNGNGTPDSEDLGAGASLDCNANDIPDECDIANGTSLDCNFNDIPDDCDIASGFSLDVAPADTVPDECDPFTGACTPPDDDDWSCTDNWSITGAFYPDDVASGAGEHVKIASPSNVLLDVSAQVPSVEVFSGATLRVTQTGSVGDLDFSSPAVLSITGTVLVSGTRAIGSGGAQSPTVVIGEGGVYKADPAAPMSVVGSSSLESAAVSASITAESMTLLPTGCFATEQLVISDQMTVTVIGDFIMDGRGSDPAICSAFGSQVASVLGGRTPPILGGCGGASLGAASLSSTQETALAGGSLTVGGSIVLREAVQFYSACGGGGSSASTSLGGDFDNQSLYPSLFTWDNGDLTLTGQAKLQSFEVAGLDFGASGEGYNTDADTLFDTEAHTNFTLGTLNVGEVGNPANVEFINRFANTAGSGSCDEALYVDTLNLSAGSALTIDNCRVYYRELNDFGATIDTFGCGALADVCQVSAPLSDGMPKNRYITFADANPAIQTAIRVTVTSMPEPFTALNGTIMWVGPPAVFSENAGKTDPAEAPGFPTFTAATLQCDPHYTDWSSHGGMIHVYDEVIVPEGGYELQAVGLGCDRLIPANYSSAMAITQSESGDVISDCATNPCGPPNGSVDITTDVTSILNKFKNLTGAPIKARSDMDFNLPDQQVNISDVTQALDAFGGFEYPFNPGPNPCPP